jgi:hypothetical protein
MGERPEEEKMPIIGGFGIRYRWFALMLIVLVLIPVAIPVGLPLVVSEKTYDFYNAIEALPDGSIVDLGGATPYETFIARRDMILAIIDQLAKNKHKMLFHGFRPETPIAMLDACAIVDIEGKYGYVYGTDYVVFDYLAGDEVALAAVAADMKLFATDYTGIPMSQLPIMDNINTLRDVDLVIDLAPEVWTFVPSFIRQWPSAYGVPSLDANLFGPVANYYGPGQECIGCLDGDRGSAEYELLTGVPWRIDLAKLEMRNLVDIPILALIVLANIGYWMRPRKEREEDQK